MSAAQVFARWRNTLPGERLSRAWRSNPLRPYAEPSLPHEAVRVYVDWRGGQFRDRGLVPFPRPPGTPRTRSGHRVLMYRPSPVGGSPPGRWSSSAPNTPATRGPRTRWRRSGGGSRPGAEAWGGS